jgi:glutathione S-transferase
MKLYAHPSSSYCQKALIALSSTGWRRLLARPPVTEDHRGDGRMTA